jgi:hypothetical protein
LNEPAAKQEAFEEANRLKNQFRALDEDEVEFLDSVLESTRAEEARVKRETAEGLALFRKQQEEADKKARRGSDRGVNDEGSPTAEEESWIAGVRKRKRTKDKEGFKGVKLRRFSTPTGPTKPSQASPARPPSPESNTEPTALTKTPVQSHVRQASSDSKAASSATPQKLSAAGTGVLGLVNYGSDEDDDW